MGAAVAVILMREREVAEAFRRAGATRADLARRPDELGVDLESLGARRLRAQSVVREAAPGQYYLDSEAWDAVRRSRRGLGIALLAVIVAAAVAFGVFRM
jgi:hypothetical protein